MRQPRIRWDTEKLRVLDEHADGNRPAHTHHSSARSMRTGPAGTSPGQPQTPGPSPILTPALQRRPPPQPSQALRAVQWLEQRHGPWARLGLAALVGAIAAALIHLGTTGGMPALVPVGVVLAAAVAAASAATRMWRDIGHAPPPVQWTATGVLAVGEGIFWLTAAAVTATIVAAIAAVALSLWLAGVLIAALFDG